MLPDEPNVFPQTCSWKLPKYVGLLTLFLSLTSCQTASSNYM